MGSMRNSSYLLLSDLFVSVVVILWFCFRSLVLGMQYSEA